MPENVNKYYKCPFPHAHPRHEQAYFKDFDSHFRIFRGREDHFSVLRLHEEIAWQMRHSEAEKRRLTEEDLERISHDAWLEAIRKSTGKEPQIVTRK